MKAFLIATALIGAQPAAAETLLRLSETAHVAVHPDQIVASLRADATAPTAAEAQATVNAAIAAALAELRKSPGIAGATGFYQVWQVTKPAPGFHAGQALELTAQDGAAMLKLVGALQGSGLALERLAWVVAPSTARAAQSDATRQALSRLKARAEESAAILGLHFASFREVRLDNTRPSPLPRMALTMSAAAAPPPSSEAQDADIQASVEGDAVLMPAP